MLLAWSRLPVVAPFTGAWIEIPSGLDSVKPSLVAPFTGAWIEMVMLVCCHEIKSSLPSRERGLKYRQ